MKIFIGGTRSIKHLDNLIQERLQTIYQKNFDVLVGDCYGVDSLVQDYYKKINYEKVHVYASAGKARNNVGGWPITDVEVSAGSHGFGFYSQKDIKMANDADYGFMIWDGKSKGTYNNIVNLVNQDKAVLVYMSTTGSMKTLKNAADLQKLNSGNISSVGSMVGLPI